MKTNFVFLTLAACGFAASVQAQTYVLESSIGVRAQVLTQGAAVTVDPPGRLTSRTTSRIVATTFGSREILRTMIARGLIIGSAQEWRLVYLEDGATGTGGPYARRSGSAPVAVPADLLVVPAFSASIVRGTQATRDDGATFVGQTELAEASASVSGIPVHGRASNGIRTTTVTVNGTPLALNVVRTTMNFHGGAKGAPSDRLIRGVMLIGEAKLSDLTQLP